MESMLRLLLIYTHAFTRSESMMQLPPMHTHAFI